MKQAITQRNNRLLTYAISTLLILSIPLIAMQFSEEVDWKLSDFIIIGVLLFGTGLLYELVVSKITDKSQRMIVALALIGLLLAVWAELAVGVFGTPFAGS